MGIIAITIAGPSQNAFASAPNSAASLVAAKGDSVTNGITLTAAGSPALDAVGDVAFRAVLKGKAVTERNRIAIVAYSNGVPTITTFAFGREHSRPSWLAENPKTVPHLSDPASFCGTNAEF